MSPALAVEHRGSQQEQALHLARVALRVIRREQRAERMGDERDPAGGALGDEGPAQGSEMIVQGVIDLRQGRAPESQAVHEDQPVRLGQDIELPLPEVRSGGKAGEEDDRSPCPRTSVYRRSPRTARSALRWRTRIAATSSIRPTAAPADSTPRPIPFSQFRSFNLPPLCLRASPANGPRKG
jgi:hypothetical protein